MGGGVPHDFPWGERTPDAPVRVEQRNPVRESRKVRIGGTAVHQRRSGRGRRSREGGRNPDAPVRVGHRRRERGCPGLGAGPRSPGAEAALSPLGACGRRMRLRLLRGGGGRRWASAPSSMEGGGGRAPSGDVRGAGVWVASLASYRRLHFTALVRYYVITL
nr:unnamed protein product [Digitaria exilis]